jgi:hypothetical protein
MEVAQAGMLFLVLPLNSLNSVRERSSRETQNTSFSRGSTQTLSMPITDLERRLSVERTLDIFTMTPKVDLIANSVVKISSLR